MFSLLACSQTGSIVEFHDPSHGAGKNHPVLGLVQGCEFKAKGGARVNIIDADGGKHSVGEKALHIILPPTKKKEVRASPPAPPIAAGSDCRCARRSRRLSRRRSSRSTPP